ncbi:MAG: DinB family protein [Gemmatimonadaceae bacterium]|nr:DinB family protein [Gemmatimonadaceae bacterium]
MDPRLAPLAETLALNTRLFTNCLAGLSDDEAHVRFGDEAKRANHAAFVAAHMVDSRCWGLSQLGVKFDNPLAHALAGARTLDDVKDALPLEATRAAWGAVSDAFQSALASATPAQLAAECKMPIPGVTQTVLGVLAFIVQHDAYHLGQLSLLRRQVGLAGMSYE